MSKDPLRIFEPGFGDAMPNEDIERFRAGEYVEVPIRDPDGQWVRLSDHVRILEREKTESDRLRGILREQRDTIKHWQHHALITSKLLACAAIDKNIEAAIDALKHKPSLSDAIKEVEKMAAEYEQKATAQLGRDASLHEHFKAEQNAALEIAIRLKSLTIAEDEWNAIYEDLS